MEEWKEALEAAVNKTIGAWNKASEAFLSHDQKGFEHWHNEFNRYVETFFTCDRNPGRRFYFLSGRKKDCIKTT